MNMSHPLTLQAIKDLERLIKNRKLWEEYHQNNKTKDNLKII